MVLLMMIILYDEVFYQKNGVFVVIFDKDLICKICIGINIRQNFQNLMIYVSIVIIKYSKSIFSHL